MNSPKMDEQYSVYEKQRYRDFFSSLSGSIAFEDDSWYCEKQLKNVSHSHSEFPISHI